MTNLYKLMEVDGTKDSYKVFYLVSRCRDLGHDISVKTFEVKTPFTKSKTELEELVLSSIRKDCKYGNDVKVLANDIASTTRRGKGILDKQTNIVYYVGEPDMDSSIFIIQDINTKLCEVIFTEDWQNFYRNYEEV